MLLLSFPRKQKLPEAVVRIPIARISLEHQKCPGLAFSMLTRGQSKPWLCFSVHLNCSSWFLNSFFTLTCTFSLSLSTPLSRDMSSGGWYGCGRKKLLHQGPRRASPAKRVMGNSLSQLFPANRAARACASLVCQKHPQGAKTAGEKGSTSISWSSRDELLLATCTPHYFVPFLSTPLCAN